MTPAKIRALRDRLGLTQAEFGDALGYAHPAIRVCELEKGAKNPSAAVVKLMEMMASQKRQRKSGT